MTGPLGPQRDDALHARMCAIIANVNRGKRGRQYTPKDFMPYWGERPEQTWQEQLAAIKQINAALGGTSRGR